LSDAGVPKGVVNIVTGFGAEAGAPMLEHSEVRAISFTGSSAVGRTIGTTAAKSFKHCSLELGGKNPMIVLDDANLDLAIEGALWGAFGTTGQRCTATSRVIVHQKVADAFAEKLAAAAAKLRVGDGLLPEIDMGPLVNQGRVGAVHEYTEIGKGEGAKLLTGGHPLTNGELGEGAYYAPTIFTNVDAHMRIAQEEIFGPVVSIIPVRDYDEAISVANSTIYGLSCAIFTENARTVFRAMRDINSGLVYINAGTTGAEPHMPFGGTKQSGNGHRELGRKAVEEFSEIKTVFVSYPSH
jgi:acyl-CoA reductase-like NAD-dependent aldehyde dehydrogenase